MTACRKGKIFSGHHVKDIGNFQSCDVQDYTRRANYCTVHIDEMRFYCENCERCICRDCAILEHQDHNKISLDQGLENIKSKIDIKVHEAQKNGSRLRSYKVSLEKRRMKVDGSIEATKEVKRIAELCILSIRQHEASVTEQLIKQKEAFKNVFENQMTMLDGKLMEIDSTLAFSQEILSRNNLPEILNVKAVLEDKLREVSVSLEPLEAMPKLGYSEVKYMQNNVFLKNAPGKLVTSDTEPLLSVADGNLTEGLVGTDGTFTVTTKNAQGQTSYCAIDEVIANINSLSGHETLQTAVTDLKDGRYSVSYKPKTPGKFTVSVEVAGSPIMGSPFTLEVKNQPDFREQADFEIQPKILEVFVKEHKKELEDIEFKYHVEIPRKADGEKVSLKPKDSCTTEDYEQACNQFVSLYQNTYQQLQMQHFSLKTETNIIGARRTISEMNKLFPVLVEIDKNQKLWCIYGEANNIEEALRFLEEEGVEVNREREDEKGRHQKEVCPICLDKKSRPRSLKCKHSFCSECIQAALNVCNKCPVCQRPQGIIQGNQPRGQMTFHVDRYSVPGYEGYGTIVIDYRLPSGLQGPEHPNPGRYYEGTSRTAYLPDNREGREVLQLLRRAFDARLVFTIGTSNTTGRSNQVIWNDIHHKTNRSGGPRGFGYPDPDYFRRVKEELAAKGIQ